MEFFPPGTHLFAAIFDRAVGARLDSAERFVRSLPVLFVSELVGCDLAWRPESRILAVAMRFDASSFGADARARLEFWCGRAGIRCSELARLPEAQRSAFFNKIESSPVRAEGIEPGALADESAEFFTQAGASKERKLPDAGPVLAIDVGGPGWAGVQFEPATEKLFLPGQLAPPRGDILTVALRFSGGERPLESRARVIEVQGPAAARAGSGVVGFTLELINPSSALERQLAANTPNAKGSQGGSEHRVYQRYTLRAPVAFAPCNDAAPDGDAAAGSSVACIDLAGDSAASEYVENLSQGGAFIRTARPAPVGTRLALSMRLPTGDELSGPAVVVIVKDHGMGVKFELPPEGEALLAAALTHLAARPRRALVVDDEEVVRRMLQDALQRRGFEVLTAPDGAAGLSLVVDEILALDLLVTDLRMPNMDGFSFLKTIRNAGGEEDLAIVVITAGVESGIEKRLQNEGADAVLDKELGPELLAKAADAVFERKRAQRLQR